MSGGWYGMERGEGGRNDPNIVCTYEYNKKRRKKRMIGFTIIVVSCPSPHKHTQYPQNGTSFDQHLFLSSICQKGECLPE
jgi:hypothetical protein